ncbi:MAG: hypothetical protein K0U60_06845 [Actinomycetia bacterium]|nr:hypothetical protein [Actinomycetes bacterium]MCH9801280.1 hypothetical protein [Actinomycetes bacterium]
MTLKNRFQLASAAGLVIIMALSGCSSSDSAESTDSADSTPTFAPEAEGEIDTGDGTSGASTSADEYCQQVSESVQEYRDFLDNPNDAGKAEELVQRSQELSEVALEIAGNPNLSEAERDQIDTCTEELVNARVGGE